MSPPTKPLRIPSYCKHKATGQAYVTLNGHVKYLGQFKLTSDRRPDCPEYHQLIARWLTNRDTLLDPPTAASATSVDQITVVELIAKFWEHAQHEYRKPDGSNTGELDCFRYALRPLNKLFGGTPAADFGPKRLKLVREEMRRMGWCRTNINRQVCRVRQCFRWGVGEELLPRDLVHGLEAVKALRRNPQEVRESDPVLPVPKPLLEAVLNACPQFVSRQVAAMIRLQLLTGMRPGEVVAMRSVDLEIGESWIYKLASHKTAHHGKTRQIPIGPQARKIISEFLKPNLHGYIFSPQDAQVERSAIRRKNRRSPMTPSQLARDKQTDARNGKQESYSVASYRRAITRACDAVFPAPKGTEANNLVKWRKSHRWHPHQLRHNAATQVRKQFGLEAARLILGHESALMTETYAEKDFEKAQAIMEQVG